MKVQRDSFFHFLWGDLFSDRQASWRSVRSAGALTFAVGLLSLAGFFLLDASDARSLGNEVKIASGSAAAGEARPDSVSEEAFDVYLAAREAIDQEGTRLQDATTHFERAIALAPNYAPAFSGLAAVYAEMSFDGQIPAEAGYARARSAARRALQLDEGLAEAHLVMAVVAAFHTRDWDEAESEFRRALDLDPYLAKAHQGHYAI